jgi:small conductance mechanosensitive channel
VFALAGGGAIAAAGGGALLVLVVGFASQRLLTDVIAGFFILFESQFGVGDFVRLEPSGISGVVEELGVRTTVVRDLNGDVCHVPNGQITAVRKVPKGWRSFQVKLVTRDPDALSAVVSEVATLAPTGSARFLRPPRISDRRDLGGGLTALRLRAEVAPSLVWLVDDFLVGTLQARAGDLLAAPPIVFSLDPAVVERYQAGLALP